MKILVVSDSHRAFEPLNKLVNMYPNMDLYLHAGDSELDEFSLMPFRTVRGNCDYFYDYQDSLTIPTPCGDLLIQHHPINSIVDLKKKNIRIFIHGHTHKRRNENINGVMVLNPGAITFARDGNELSYMLLTIENDNVIVEFKTL